MREIKFRAWDNLRKIMMGEVIELRFGNQEDSVPGVVAGDTQSHNFELMQYTGLKDKHGKEIYESDIVRMLYTDWGDEEKSKRNGKVEWKHDRWVLNFGIGEYGNDDTGTLIPGAHGYMEVIGDIYQNPELLN